MTKFQAKVINLENKVRDLEKRLQKLEKPKGFFETMRHKDDNIKKNEE